MDALILMTVLASGAAPPALTEAVEAALRAHPAAGGDVRLAALQLPPQVAAPAGAGVRWRVELREGDDFLGATTLPVHAEQGGRTQTLWVRAELHRRVEVVVARREVPGGEPVAAADLEVETRWLSSAPRGLLRTLPDDAGPVLARRTLRPGEPLRENDLRYEPLAERGASVRLVVRRGALEVSAVGLLLQGGRRGERVRVRNQGSGRHLEGVLVAADRVEVGR